VTDRTQALEMVQYNITKNCY